MTKLIFHSNAPWSPTGYGQQCALFAPILAKHYDTAISSFYGLEGAPITWEGIPVFPGVQGNFGDQYLVQHAKHFFGGNPRDGLVVTLMDVWVLNPGFARQVNMACWVPVDHEPAPPAVTQFFLDSGAVPIAMSKFGEQMLGRLDPLYVPHGVDTDVFKPHDKKKIRETTGVPADAFLVGMVAANKGRPSRKCFSQAFQAFRKFAESHNDAYLYLHTNVTPGAEAGENLPALLEALDIPSDRVLITDQYRVLFNPHPASAMAQIYSTMDVLLNPAMGEGFGIPVLEAQACGVPAIVTNFSSMKEVCGAGWHVGCRPYWTGQESWMAQPDVDDIAEALEDAYSQDARSREKLANGARRHAMEYSLPRVTKQWLSALRVIEQRFASQEPVRIPSRLKAAAA